MIFKPFSMRYKSYKMATHLSSVLKVLNNSKSSVAGFFPMSSRLSQSQNSPRQFHRHYLCQTPQCSKEIHHPKTAQEPLLTRYEVILVWSLASCFPEQIHGHHGGQASWRATDYRWDFQIHVIWVSFVLLRNLQSKISLRRKYSFLYAGEFRKKIQFSLSCKSNLFKS